MLCCKSCVVSIYHPDYCMKCAKYDVESVFKLESDDMVYRVLTINPQNRIIVMLCVYSKHLKIEMTFDIYTLFYSNKSYFFAHHNIIFMYFMQ